LVDGIRRMVHNDSGFIGARAQIATKKRFVI
jgi:hypothetical protein